MFFSILSPPFPPLSFCFFPCFILSIIEKPLRMSLVQLSPSVEASLWPILETVKNRGFLYAFGMIPELTAYQNTLLSLVFRHP